MERALDCRCVENDGGGALGSRCDGKDGSRGWKWLWIAVAARVTANNEMGLPSSAFAPGPRLRKPGCDSDGAPPLPAA